MGEERFANPFVIYDIFDAFSLGVLFVGIDLLAGGKRGRSL